MIAAIYARVSKKQDGKNAQEESDSPGRQTDDARQFIAAKGWRLDERHVYTDDGVSGGLFLTRPEFQRLMRDADAGAFEAVVFFDLDRFGRDGHQTMVALNTLEGLGVSVWDCSTGARIDLNSFETRLPTILKAEFAQQYREQVRKHTRAAMRKKAEQGFVTGGKLFGYDNVKVAKGQTTRTINEAEATVVRDIYERFASGDGLRTIASALNASASPSPRAQQGRPSGWSSSSVREVLARSAYRGEMIFGRTANAYGHEVKKAWPKSTREHAQITQPEDRWIRSTCHAIVTPDLAARVDKRRDHWRSRAVEAKQRGRAPQNASGKYLLSGGLLVCPTCGGHFEAFKSPWKPDGVYVCATRRRKPGVCTNTLALPMAATDETVLEMIEGEVLGTRYIEQLLSLVDKGDGENAARLAADRQRLEREMSNLLDLAASGVATETLAPKIREREHQIAKLDAQLRTPRPVPPDVEKLRLALSQRAEQWKSDLRAEPKVARLLLRRLVGPLTLWNAAEPSAEWIEWETSLTPALIEGLASIQVMASPTGFERLRQDITHRMAA
jgi:site-specific DNA recombinase